jgi:hypothetical protein
MRSVVAATVALAAAAGLVGPCAAASAPITKSAALASGDWREAAALGATAAEVLRALQARGEFGDLAPEEAVVTIRPDNTIEAVALEPLPPLPADVARAGARTAGLSGSGFTFAAGRGSIILYPAYAASFVGPGAVSPEPPR